jgi:hypothetical protein
MQRPRREEFILEVRRSARTLQKPNVEADADVVDTDAIARILGRAALWLTTTARTLPVVYSCSYTVGWPNSRLPFSSAARASASFPLAAGRADRASIFLRGMGYLKGCPSWPGAMRLLRGLGSLIDFQPASSAIC